MNTIQLPSRRALATCYAVLVVLPCVLIMLPLPQFAVAVTFIVYAFALLPAFYLDHWLFGGIGYHSLAIFVLLAAVVAALLWPLGLLSASSAVWRSVSWRRAILGYGAALLAFVIFAAWQMTRSVGLFFG